MNAQADPQPEIERIKGRIIALAGEHFATGEERYYFSAIGTALGDDRVLIEKLTGQKLGEFIPKNFEFEIGTSGQRNNVRYIVRPESAGPATITAKAPTIRYAREFWQAFSIPLPQGQRRFIDVDTLNVMDEPPVPQLPSVREIGELFVAPDLTTPARTIGELIAHWLEQEKLDAQAFIQSPKGVRHEAPTLMSQILDALDGEQLKRTSLPLDVIKALTERRAR